MRFYAKYVVGGCSVVVAFFYSAFLGCLMVKHQMSK